MSTFAGDELLADDMAGVDGMMVWAIQAHAQKKLVAIDIETLQPVAGANVISKAGTMITDSLGYVSVAPSTSFSAIKRLMKSGYVIRMNDYEVEDPFFKEWIIRYCR